MLSDVKHARMLRLQSFKTLSTRSKLSSMR
jgi:hypothetical protein